MSITLGSTDYTLLTTTTNAALSASLGQQILIITATVCNTDASTHKVTIWRVPGGGTVSTQPDMIWDAFPVDSLKTVPVPIAGQTLTNGSGLFAIQASGSGVNLNIGWAQLA